MNFNNAQDSLALQANKGDNTAFEQVGCMQSQTGASHLEAMSCGKFNMQMQHGTAQSWSTGKQR